MFSIRSVPTACTARPSLRKCAFGSASLNRLILSMDYLPSQISLTAGPSNKTAYSPARTCASQRRRKRNIHIELNRDLAQAAMHGHYFAKSRIEIIFQHHRPRILQIKVGCVRDGCGSQNAQFVPRRKVLPNPTASPTTPARLPGGG